MTGSSTKSEINVTPLIDVVLVLLIVFMIITPLVQVGHEVRVPTQVKSPHASPPEQLLLRMDEEGRTYIGGEEVALDGFGDRLRRILADPSPRMVLFEADDDLDYARVAEFLDLCRASGARDLAMVFEPRPPGERRRTI